MRMVLRTALAGLATFLCVGAAAAQTSDDDMFKLMKSETIGELRLDMTEAQLKRALPDRPAKGAERLWGADGQYHQRWNYAKHGLRLSMVSAKKGGAKTIESVECAARCTLKSARGIGVGSTLAEVQKAYAAEFNKEESKLPGSFVAGTIYGGLIFTLKGGKVAVMYLGAAAE